MGRHTPDFKCVSLYGKKIDLKVKIYTNIKMVVYCFKKDNEIVYIGSTENWENRYKTYKRDFKYRNTKFFKAWRELGWDALTYEWIDDLSNQLTKTERLILETEYIEKCNPAFNTYKRAIRTEKASFYTMEWEKANPEKRAANRKKTFAKWYEANGEARAKAKREGRARIKLLRDLPFAMNN